MVDEIVSDEELVEGLRRGSPQAHEQLWQKYGNPLISFLQALGADASDADDAAIDAVARAVEKIDQFDPQKAVGGAPFRNWLFTIARRVWQNQVRKQKKFISYSDDVVGGEYMSGLDEPSAELTEAVNHAMSNLPDNQRQTIIMHFYDGLALSEIAHLKGVPEGTVRQWKKRALTALKPLLQDIPAISRLIERG